jgi:hypothetical protein
VAEGQGSTHVSAITDSKDGQRLLVWLAVPIVIYACVCVRVRVWGGRGDWGGDGLAGLTTASCLADLVKGVTGGEKGGL